MRAAWFHFAFVAAATATVEDCGAGEQFCKTPPPSADRDVLMQMALQLEEERTDGSEQVSIFHKGNRRAQNQQDPCEVCTFNPAYVCLVGGQCWGYSSASSCQSAGGAMCVLPTCPQGQIVVNKKCVVQLNTEPERWVRVHNIFRCMHGVPPVRWNAAAAENAQQYVNGLSSLQHSDCYHIPPPAGPAGENLAMGQSSLETATLGWYNEVKDCAWPGCESGECGHFTAMVWKATLEIGCAKNSNNIYICRYLNEPGNSNGAYAANVVQPSKSFDTCIAEVQSSAPAAPAAPQAPAATTPSPTSPPALPSGGCNDPNGWKGDGGCDAMLNTAECNWDGGDCPHGGAAPTQATTGGSCATLSGCTATLNDATSGCSFTVSCSKSNGWSASFSRGFGGQTSWTKDYSTEGCVSCTMQIQ